MTFDIRGDGYVLHFPDDWDERAEFEMTAKGYAAGLRLVSDAGTGCELTIYDPVRLRQDFDSTVPAYAPCLAEPGLIVVPDVTREAITRAIEYMVATKFFAAAGQISGSLNGHSLPVATVGT